MPKLLNFRKPLSIENKSTKKAEISIYGVIGASFWEEGITAKSFNEELKKLDSNVEEITLRINSPGGDVFDGITIMNRLKQHKASITVYIDGLAASIASIIAMSGDKVIMGEGALMMIHKPMTMGYGNSSDFEELIKRLDDVEEQLLSIYQRKTKMDRSELRNMLAKATWMDADEALSMGFVDEKMAKDEELNIAACDNAFWLKDMPKIKSKNDFIKGKINNLRSSVGSLLASSAVTPKTK
jgi:ATP-dependent protease ClpP protease subunit